MPNGAPANTLQEVGGYIPSIAAVTAAGPAGGMASDSATLARWWSRLCGGRIVLDPSLEAMTDFDDGDGYGLGLFEVADTFGSTAVGNGGIQVGYTSYEACVLDSGSVVVVLSNGSSDLSDAADALVVAADPR